MLVAIEGLTDDCRWQVVQGIAAHLEATGVPATAVPERVCAQLTASEVLAGRPAAAAIAAALAHLTDLYMADHAAIGPALAAGRVVVKDRHVDALNYLARPDLLSSGAVAAEERAIRWLNGMATELRLLPDLAIYLDHDGDTQARPGWEELITGVASTSTRPTPASVIEDLLRHPGHRRLLPVDGRPLAEVITAASALVQECIDARRAPLTAVRPGLPGRRRRRALV